jgi:hypothetical protein
MTTGTHRFRRATAALSPIGVLSITACAPAATDASTTTASTSASTTVSTTSSTSAESATAGTTAETTTDTAAAAQEFLATLSEEQRERVLHAYDDETKTTSWSNFPVISVERAGLNPAVLTEERKRLLLEVIANWVGLSAEETRTEALATIEATLGETYVNRSGTTAYDMSAGGGTCFRISGPDVYIEFSDQQGPAGADVDGAVTQQECTGMGGPGAGAPLAAG